ICSIHPFLLRSMTPFFLPKKTCLYFYLLLVGLFTYSAADAQFRKAFYNRFNYHHYQWQVLPTSAYYLYFPRGYDSLASFASLHLPVIMQKVKNTTGTSLAKRPNVIIYPSVSQSYESNIGCNE